MDHIQKIAGVRAARRIATLGGILMVTTFILSMSSSAEAREGWYFDFTIGPAFDVGFNNVHNEFPDGVSTDAEVGVLNEIDFGYSFKKRFTFGVGFELTNLVDVGYKFDFKWSFLEGHDIQPYVYFCAHGGITDWTMFAIHPGMGIDMWVTDRTYFTLDGRIGYSLESADIPKDAAGNRNYDNKMEAALSFGVGVLLGSKSSKK